MRCEKKHTLKVIFLAFNEVEHNIQIKRKFNKSKHKHKETRAKEHKTNAFDL